MKRFVGSLAAISLLFAAIPVSAQCLLGIGCLQPRYYYPPPPPPPPQYYYRQAAPQPQSSPLEISPGDPGYSGQAGRTPTGRRDSPPQEVTIKVGTMSVTLKGNITERIKEEWHEALEEQQKTHCVDHFTGSMSPSQFLQKEHQCLAEKASAASDIPTCDSDSAQQLFIQTVAGSPANHMFGIVAFKIKNAIEEKFDVDPPMRHCSAIAYLNTGEHRVKFTVKREDNDIWMDVYGIR